MRKHDSWWDESALTVIIAGTGAWVGDAAKDHPVIGAVVGAVIGVALSAWLRLRYVKPWSEAVDFADDIAKQIDTANEKAGMLVKERERLEQDLKFEREENGTRGVLITEQKEQTAALRAVAASISDQREGPKRLAAAEARLSEADKRVAGLEGQLSEEKARRAGVEAKRGSTHVSQG